MDRCNDSPSFGLWNDAIGRCRRKCLPDSALATIGLTVPLVVLASIMFGLPLVLGLSPKEIALLALTFLVSSVTLGTGRTYLMQGAVHLVSFAAYLFLALVP